MKELHSRALTVWRAEQWDLHSVTLLTEISSEFSGDVLVMSQNTFFPLDWGRIDEIFLPGNRKKKNFSDISGVVLLSLRIVSFRFVTFRFVS